MTYINLSRHDARLGGDLRLRLAQLLSSQKLGSVRSVAQVYSTNSRNLFEFALKISFLENVIVFLI